MRLNNLQAISGRLTKQRIRWIDAYWSDMPHETSMHMPRGTRDMTSNFIIHLQHPLSGLSGRPTQFVHMIPAFTSSNTLTGRTGRLHVFQTLVPSHRAQVFI